jgi:hypothetical protein
LSYEAEKNRFLSYEALKTQFFIDLHQKTPVFSQKPGLFSPAKEKTGFGG